MLVALGTVLKPRGLKGELKIGITYNRPAIFQNLNTVYLHDQRYHVLKSSLQNGFGYLYLEGVDSFEKADKLRNHELLVAEEVLQLGTDEVLSTALIGFAVCHQGQQIGKITAVENYGGGDCLEIALTGRQEVILVPNEDDFILETNMSTRTITLTEHALDVELV